MQRRYFAVVFLVFSGFFAFADTGEPEELDFLLFLPNSAQEFADAERAMIQLDIIAKYVLGKNPAPGQIYVYGYSADVINDIDPIDLSKARALLVMEQLQKRGLVRELFAEPVAYGSVDLWGNNAEEADRIPNRRVRIVLDGAVLTQAVLEPVEPEIIIPVADENEIVVIEEFKEVSGSAFPWIWLLLLIPLALLLFLLARLKRKPKTVKPVPAEIPADSPPVIVETTPVIAATADTSMKTSELIVNLDEEIRYRAYILYLLRYGQNEDHINDWYRAVTEICGRYDASGYQTYQSDGSWWARKTLVIQTY